MDVFEAVPAAGDWAWHLPDEFKLRTTRQHKLRLIQVLSRLDGTLCLALLDGHGCYVFQRQEDLHWGWCVGCHCSNVSTVDKFGVKWGTLRNRLQSVHCPAKDSQQDKQHLTDTEEHVLCIALSTEAKLPAHWVNGPFFTRSKKSSGISPLRNGTSDFSKDT